MKKGYIIVGAALAVAILGFANEAAAYGSSGNAEEKVFGILDRVLDMLANFLERIFQSIADAVRSVFTGSGAAEKSSSAADDLAKKAFDFYKTNQ